MKVFTFYDDSWWDNPPCDCCTSHLMEAYNSPDTDPNLGTAHSIEDCYTQAIITLTNDYNSTYWELSLEQLEEIANKLNIKVEVV